jgi:hypothetical protein
MNVAELAKAVVTIEATSLSGVATGSGVIVDSTGIIATAAHVLAGASRATVRLSTGEMLPVEAALDVDERLDMALVRVAGFSLPTARLGNSDALVVGQRLLAIGTPLGLEATVTDGILSSIRIEQGTKHLQISVPVSPGSSGGPVFNEQGAVIGLVVSGIRGGGAENLNFALPINYVRGKLEIAKSRPLVPFSEAFARISMAETGSGATVGASGQPPVVNNSLGLDFTDLDGVEIWSDSKDEQGLRHIVQVTYQTGNDQEGNPTVQRLTNDRARVKVAALRSTDAFIDHLRTDLTLGAVSRISETLTRTALIANVTPASLSLSLEGSQFVAVTTQGRTSGMVPVGALTVRLFSAAIAALPESLPSEVFIWFFDPTTGRAEAQRITFGRAESLFVPLAQGNQKCDEGINTKPTRLDVRWAAATIGAQRQEFPVLARRPHLRVDPDIVRCVRLVSARMPAPN